jgi:iron(III) transport system permease protein
MGRLLNTKRATLVAASIALAAIGVLPLCLMVASSLWVNGHLSPKNYADALGSARTWATFGNSLLLAVLTTAVAGIAGVTLALLISKTDLHLGGALSAFFSLPLFFPPYILAVGWFEILGRGGILAHWIGPVIAERTSRWLFGLPGAVLVLASAFLPVVLLLTITYVRGVNPGLEEAARLHASWPVVLRHITIPLIAPGVLLALVLVFLLSMGEFGAPAFLRLNVFPVASMTQSSAFYNFGSATAAAMPLIVVALVGLLLMQGALKDNGYSFRGAGRPADERIPLGRKSPLVFVVVAGLAMFLVGGPLAAVVWRGASIPVLRDALERAGGSAVRSLEYAGLAATTLCILGFFLAYLIYRRALATWWWIDASAVFLFTLPGAVLGIGLIGLWNHPSTNWIYATPAILILGFVGQYAALGTRIVLAGFTQISPSLEEAAEVAGVNWFRRVSGILAPVVRPVLIASWAVTFIFCVRDVALPLLLSPPGGDTLTARTMTLMANGSPELIAALCLLAMGLVVAPLGLLGAVWRYWGKFA